MRYIFDGLLNLCTSNRRCLKVVAICALIRQILTLLEVNDSLLSEIDLVAEKNQRNVERGSIPEAFQPLFDLLKRPLVRNIVHNNGAIGSPQVSLRYGTEFVLPGCIPNL